MTSTTTNLILPVGTQVVTRRPVRTGSGMPIAPEGAVGRVVGAPADAHHAYRVAFPDGREASLRRHELSVRKQHVRDGVAEAGAALREYDLHRHVILRVVVGSRAYGLDDAGSDVDTRGVYLPPASLHWSLYGVPEQLESPGTDEVYWELQKFLGMALKANPNILEVLNTPLVEAETALGAELRAERHRFVSRMVFQTYNGYVLSQFRKMEQDLRTTGAPRWKHAMHLLRLLLSGATILREGTVPVRMDAHRDALRAIRRGEVPWDEVNAWRLRLHAEMDAAMEASPLPERPDYAWANDFLVRARRGAVEPA